MNDDELTRALNERFAPHKIELRRKKSDGISVITLLIDGAYLMNPLEPGPFAPGASLFDKYSQEIERELSFRQSQMVLDPSKVYTYVDV